MILLDIEKAFDKIWKEGLIYKLMKLKLPHQLIKIIQWYLKDRTFNVKYKTQYLIRKSLRREWFGISWDRSYSTCSLNDLPKTKLIKIGLFAVDTAIFRTGSLKGYLEINLIQKELDILSLYYENWTIKINSNKTQGIIFAKKLKRNKLKPTDSSLTMLA